MRLPYQYAFILYEIILIIWKWIHSPPNVSAKLISIVFKYKLFIKLLILIIAEDISKNELINKFIYTGKFK